jgi:transcription elongation factor SPT5
VSDPRLWQVRVKRGLERQVCMSLINKSIDFARKGHPLAILSTTSNENVEGYIYIEAFKEIHVREAVKGLSAILGNKL